MYKLPFVSCISMLVTKTCHHFNVWTTYRRLLSKTYLEFTDHKQWFKMVTHEVLSNFSWQWKLVDEAISHFMWHYQKLVSWQLNSHWSLDRADSFANRYHLLMPSLLQSLTWNHISSLRPIIFEVWSSDS